MPMFSCQVCGKSAYVKPSHAKKGWGKYCSNKCNAEAQKTGEYIACHVCKKQVYKSLKDQSRSKSGKYFCGKSCQALWRNSTYVGKNHSNWKGGTSSYRDILRRAQVPAVCKRCNNTDTRVLSAHHKDRNRQNNSISNLIWLCYNCHYLVHHHKGESKKFLVPVA